MTQLSYAFTALFALSALALSSLVACGGAGAGGIPDDCEIRYEGQCYMTATEACAAAECPEDRCLILESYPGQVACEAEPRPDPDGTEHEPTSSSAPGAEGSPCDATTTCGDGLTCDGPEGCDVPWTCQPMRPCTRDLVVYCGCDGETFEGGGNCAGRPYAGRGPCGAGAAD